MEIKTLIISLLTFSAVIIGLNIFTLDLANHYSMNIDDMATLSQAQAIQTQVETMHDSFYAHVTGTILDIPIGAIAGGVEFIKLVSTSLFGFWDTFFGPVAQYLYLPTWFVGIISAIVMVTIIFAAFRALKWGY